METTNTHTSENSRNIQSAEYRGGSVDYEVIEADKEAEHNPLVFIPGFARGLVSYRGLGEELSLDGSREVILVGQPVYKSLREKVKSRKLSFVSALDHQAEALLAVIEASGLTGKPVDFVAHSFGSLILYRAAEIAKERNVDMTPFDHTKGSHSIFLSPAGTVEDDSVGKVKARFEEHKEQSRSLGRRGNEEYRELDEEVAKYMKNKFRTIREALVLGKLRLPYAELGRLGLKPMILGFPRDLVAPDELIGRTIHEAGESIAGYATPIAPEGTHDDVVFAPANTVKAIFQFLNQK